MNKTIFRSKTNKVIAGICGGLGETSGIDPVVFRILFVVSIFAGGIGILLYIIGWIIIPTRPLENNFVTEENHSKQSENANNCMETENLNFESHSSERDNNHTTCKKNNLENFSHQIKSATTTTTIVLGVIFILIGTLIMLYKLDIIAWRFRFSEFISYWPLGLVLIGCSLIPMHKILRTVIVVLIFGLWIGLCAFGEKSSRLLFSCTHSETTNCMKSDEHTLSVPYNSSIQSAKCEVEFDASDNTLTTTSDQLLQFHWNTANKRPTYRLISSTDDGLPSYKISPKGSLKDLGIKTSLMLNPDVQWELDIESNASNIDYDLSPFFIDKLSLESNASNIVLIFGSKAPVANVEIESNASSITIHIPKEYGCRLYSESTLSNIEATDFISKGKRQSESSNYATATKKINIELETNFCEIIIKQY